MALSIWIPLVTSPPFHPPFFFTPHARGKFNHIIPAISLANMAVLG
jgi:hypothetical protein